jgi:hypothetical protein
MCLLQSAIVNAYSCRHLFMQLTHARVVLAAARPFLLQLAIRCMRYFKVVYTVWFIQLFIRV